MLKKISSWYVLWNRRKILFLWTNPSNEVAISFAWRKFSSIQVRGHEGRSRRDKSLSLGRLPMDPPLKYSSSIIGFSHGTIFLFLYILCAVLGASVCFYFQFVRVLFSGLCNKLDPCMFVWERDRLRFFIIHSCSSLIYVECLAFVIFLQLLFSSISCSELLAFVVRNYCSCCFTLLVSFQISWLVFG